MSRPAAWLPRVTLTAAMVLLAVWLTIAALVPSTVGVDGQAPAPRVTVDVAGSFSGSS